MLSAHCSRWAEYSFTLWPFMLRRRRERPSAAANATGGPFAVSDRSEVALGAASRALGPFSWRYSAPLRSRLTQEWFWQESSANCDLNYTGKCRGWILLAFFLSFFFFFLLLLCSSDKRTEKKVNFRVTLGSW